MSLHTIYTISLLLSSSLLGEVAGFSLETDSIANHGAKPTEVKPTSYNLILNRTMISTIQGSKHTIADVRIASVNDYQIQIVQEGRLGPDSRWLDISRVHKIEPRYGKFSDRSCLMVAGTLLGASIGANQIELGLGDPESIGEMLIRVFGSPLIIAGAGREILIWIVGGGTAGMIGSAMFYSFLPDELTGMINLKGLTREETLQVLNGLVSP